MEIPTTVFPASASTIQRQGQRAERQAKIHQCDVELIKILRLRAVLTAEEGYDQATRAERAKTAQLIERIDDLLRRLLNPPQLGRKNNHE